MSVLSLRCMLRSLPRSRVVECFSVRRFSAGGEIDDAKLRQYVDYVADEVTPDAKQAVKKELFKRLAEISKDSFLEATSSQYDELLAMMPKTAPEKTIIPSKNAIMRKSMDASQSVRREVFAILHNRGMSAEDAHKRAEVIYSKLVDEFNKKQIIVVKKAQGKAQAENKLIKRAEESQADVLKFMSRELRRLFDLDNEYEFEAWSEVRRSPRGGESTKMILPLSNSLFDNSQSRLDIFDMDKLKPNNLEFWQRWDDEKTAIVNQGMGPTNAFEKQIEWTKRGKMWPYPINNEYMFHNERNVSFVDHVFLEPYWKKHNVPKSRAVDQFMELVLVGLSKNPYMPIEKKHRHIDWFANYFKDVIGGKYKSVL